MEHDITYTNVSRETLPSTDILYKKFSRSIEDYLDQLLWWNKRINLISRDVPRETTKEHIYHSLLLHGFKAFQEANFVVDAGTGGGLPGLPLAITHPSKKFLLNDIVTKKTLSVKQMARKIQLKNVDVSDKSIAEVDVNNPFLMISKHAFKINDLIKMASGQPWTEIIFYKGLDFKDELAGVDTHLAITAFDLSKLGAFYHEKAIVVVSK